MPFPDMSPRELPDGRLVCEDHGLQICGVCCCDYTIFDEDEGDASDDGSDEDGVDSASEDDDFDLDSGDSVYPRLFAAPAGKRTWDLFIPGTINGRLAYVHHKKPNCSLVHTDGACPDNGKPGARGGCGIVFGPPMSDMPWSTSFALEAEGADRRKYEPTSNRAELRAVIAVLESLHTNPSGRDTLVIATDSEYVVKGAVEYMPKWVKKGWKTSAGKAVQNKDMWEELLDLYVLLRGKGVEVKFWRIGREENGDADRLAKLGAEKGAVTAWVAQRIFG